MTDINTPTNEPELDIHDEAEMKAIEDFDYGRVGGLLHIMEKIVGVAPKCMAIFGIAQAELEILNEKAKDIAKSRAERFKEAEQRRADAEQQRLQAERDEAEANAERTVNPPAKARSIPANPQPAPVPGPGEPTPPRRL